MATKSQRLVTEKAFEDAVGLAVMPINRPTITTPIDADTYRTVTQVGGWGVRASNLTNGPAGLADRLGVFEVIWYAANGVMQRFTTADGMWFRTAANQSWNPWQQVALEGQVVPRVRGTLPEMDLDDLRGAEWVGTWHLAGVSTYEHMPVTTSIATAITLESGNTAGNADTQRLVIEAGDRPLEMWVRKLRNTTGGVSTWSPWERLVRASELEDLVSGSGLVQDVDGVWYVPDPDDSDGPQPAWRRIVDESHAPDLLPATVVQSATISRILVSNDPDEPLENGDLLLVYGG